MTFSVASIRKDFPMLAEKINDQPLIYLDSAASAQKPLQVIEKEREFLCYPPPANFFLSIVKYCN